MRIICFYKIMFYLFYKMMFYINMVFTNIRSLSKLHVRQKNAWSRDAFNQSFDWDHVIIL